MPRKYCTDCNGNPFRKAVRDRVWNKAQEVEDKDPKKWRVDKYGKLIKYDKYGKTTTWGWEIDHSKPVARHKGTDHINNLQALYWKHNRLKSNIYPFSLEKLEELRRRG